MLVCAHGEVSEYCESHDMIIVERYGGKIEDYDGCCCVLVTDREMSSAEYCFLKGQMLARGVDLVSTRYADTEVLDWGFAPEQKRGGRPKFGERSEAEMAVVRKIFELKDSGATYREIQDDENVCYLDGRKIPISTIQVILKNRDSYGRTD